MSDEFGVILDKNTFVPGETLTGNAGWSFAERPKKGYIRLFWRAQGERDGDVRIVEEISVDLPQAAQVIPFAFTLPNEPYTYDGTLFSIHWGVEFVLDHHADVAEFSIRG